MMASHPKFIELPLDPSHPPHSAWGLYGNDDERGTLNLLTPERTREAAKEIKTGISVGLNWPVHMMDYAGESFREPTKHEIFEIGKNMNDDKLTLNTQIGSQWDGLRHWGFDDGRFYNGLTQADIYSKKTSRLGIHAWTKEGIIGRGVLIDFAAFAARNSIIYDPLSFYAVSLHTVQEIAAESNIVFQPGDILLLRTGFTHAYETAEMSVKKRIMTKSPFEYPGTEATLSVLQFLWDTRIAAVAGDCPGFEAWPPSGANPDSEGVLRQGMHQTLLAGFGMPIGEMFDLEGLSRECERQQRWSFFLSSMPLNVLGGVASPPNAVAIF